MNHDIRVMVTSEMTGIARVLVATGVALALGSGGCVATESTLCASGRRCPAGTFCAADGDMCIGFNCGDGVVDGPEEVCDDGDNLARDGCSPDCKSNEQCGNGVTDVATGETCDDGNRIDGDGCQANCTAPLCGDGVVDDDAPYFEVCDAGAANSFTPDAPCRPNCQPRRCGDGIRDAGEVCDDGNLAVDDGCTPDCQSNETCGNGVVDIVVGEECDDGDRSSRDGCTSTCVLEQPSWSERSFSTLASRGSHAMAYDAARGRIVIFGGLEDGARTDDTWEWDGVIWTRITPSGSSPSPRSSAAMVYDSARRRVVLFGGRSGSVFQSVMRGDTWEWDGRAWTEVTPAGPSPSARFEHAMAYDASRGRVVLFGGSVSSSYPYEARGDTWEWDGATWARIVHAGPAPEPRLGHAMAYDAARDQVILHGGGDPWTYRDTWAWDGTRWTSITPATTSPSYQQGHAMAYDAIRERVVLYDDDETWEWDGEDWSDRSLSGSAAPPHGGHAVVFDAARGRVVLTGSGTWEWDGEVWSERPAASPPPSSRSYSAMAYDAGRGRVVLFGGGCSECADTWEWDGTTWTDVTPDGPSPPSGRYNEMVYDSTRRRVVLIHSSETWEWDGETWTEVGDSPGWRWNLTVAHRDADATTLLFGGGFWDGEVRGDTWKWDGEVWTEVTPDGPSPSPRQDHAMAYDPVRDRVVLFGGRDDVNRGDTWEWDGERWIEMPRAGAAPSPRHGHTMTYNPDRGRIVLFGGDDGILRGDTWEWDGATWTEIASALSPSPRRFHAMAYDAIRGHMVLVGGSSSGSEFIDMWHFTHARDDQVYETCVHGFDSDGDGAIGCDDPDCWGYCAPFCPPASARAGICHDESPRCGDGACNADLETCLNCPDDCGSCVAMCGDFLCGPDESELTCPADCAARG